MGWRKGEGEGTIHSLTLDAIVTIVFRNKELEVRFRVFDRADLIFVIDEVARQS